MPKKHTGAKAESRVRKIFPARDREPESTLAGYVRTTYPALFQIHQPSDWWVWTYVGSSVCI